jgi:hypothetical protein
MDGVIAKIGMSGKTRFARWLQHTHLAFGQEMCNFSILFSVLVEVTHELTNLEMELDLQMNSTKQTLRSSYYSL